MSANPPVEPVDREPSYYSVGERQVHFQGDIDPYSNELTNPNNNNNEIDDFGEEMEEDKTDTNFIKSDPWRFAVGPIFCFLSLSNAMQWIAFSPIVDEVRTFFSMDATQVNFLATTYVLAYVVIVFLSCKLYEVTGIKMGVVIAAVSNALGALIKIIALYAYPHAALLYVAQVINSFCEVLTIATPPLIANRWFPEGERIVANTILSSALNFGCGIGVLFPTFFVTPEKQEKKHFGNFFWFHFGLTWGALALCVFLFPKKPRYSASYAAQHQQVREEERLRMVNQFMRHRNDSETETSASDFSPNDELDVAAAEKKKVVVEEDLQLEDINNNNNEVVEFNGKLQNVEGMVVEDEKEELKKTKDAKKKRRRSRRRKNKKNKKSGDGEDDDEEDDGNEQREVEPINIFSVLKDCFREFRHNYSFLLLILASAAELGLLWGVATVLPQMLSPYSISEAISGWIGFLNLVLGTIVCPFFMPLIDKYGKRYKLVLCTLSVVVVVMLTLLTLLLHFGPTLKTEIVDGVMQIVPDQFYYVCVVFVLWGGIVGLCMNMMMPVMFEFVVELTFPMQESTSAPCLTWSACLTNFLITISFGQVLTDNPTEDKALRCFIGSTVVAAVGAVSFFLCKPLHKRQDYENSRREEAALLLAGRAEQINSNSNDINNNNNNTITVEEDEMMGAPVSSNDKLKEGAAVMDDNNNNNNNHSSHRQREEKEQLHGKMD